MSILHQLENAGRRIFAGSPAIKRFAKGAYQRLSYAVMPKMRCEGTLRRVSPVENASWFFGYYDKCPWDESGRYMLCLRTAQPDSPAPRSEAQLMCIDTQDGSSFEIARTHAWNVQQGCMAQWLGPDYSSRILYNDFREGRYVAVIYDFAQRREERVLERALYTVSLDGRTGMSVDFSRLHRLRPGYGYSNLPDESREEPCPDTSCIWRVNLADGSVTPILRYSWLAAFEPRPEMQGAVHKVNHLMLNPSGTRLMLLHRWFVGQKKYTRLLTCNTDGSELYNLSDGDFVSHCNWKNDREILGYLRRDGRDAYYLLRDFSPEATLMWPALDTDGHMSYSPDGTRIVTDSYPDQRRLSSVYLLREGGQVLRLARVFSPFRYDGDLRCDLHPRWNRSGRQIAIDSTHEGHRALYVIDVPEESAK